MAITINVQGAPASGGGGNNQNPTPQPQQPTPTPQPSNPPSQQPQPTGGQNNSSNSIPFTVTQGAPTQPASPQPTQPTQQPNTGSQQNQTQPTTQTVSPTGQNPPANQPKPSQPIRYQRPDFNQFKSNGQSPINQPLPTSERMVNDVRAEISRRGIILVPGTQNFSTMLNTLQQQQRGNIMGQIDSVHDARIQDIDKRDAALYTEIKARLDASRQSELDGVTDPLQASIINKRYNELEDREFKNAGKFFAGEYAQVESDRSAQKAEAEQRLTEALQRLTEELSQGNKDSYLGQLRDKYKTAVWKRDNAATEEEVREASREASKVQERMQRAMSGDVLSAATRGRISAGAGLAMMGLNGLFNYLHQSDSMAWNLGIEQAGSVLSGNAFNAIRQRNAREIAINEGIGQTVGGVVGGGLGLWGGAALGAKVGTAGGPWGAIGGAILGAVLGTLGSMAGKEVTYYTVNRPKLRENAQAGAADLWRQEEQRMLQFNDLAMLTRGEETDVDAVRNWYIMGGAKDYADNDENQNTVNTTPPAALELGGGGGNAVATTNAFDEYTNFNLYDLGYTAPEFAQKAAQRIKQRGFVGYDSVKNALYADALERIFSMNPGSLGALSQYDRFGKNNANQDFANLAVTLDKMNTTGMRNGAWARSDEFAGYMTQLQDQQRSVFLTVNNERAARQIATGQGIFGDKFGPQAMQGIQQVNDRIQNPTGGFAQTLLYDVIQELFPDTRGRIDKIEQAQYDPAKQNRIQQEYQKRIESIYGSVDTTSGYLAAQDIWGIKNPNVMMPIVRQLSKGGLQAHGLEKADQDELIKPISEGSYTPKVTKQLNISADNQMRDLLKYSESLVDISASLLEVIKKDTNETLKKALEELRNN